MPDTVTPLCNPWTVEARPFSQWNVQGAGGINPWSTALGGPPGGWNLAGYNVRRTEEECERITEDGQLRIVE